jgi:co-chaperonin GroES (HSP10)
MKTEFETPKAIGDRILVEVTADKEKETKSDFLVIPDSVNEEYNKRVLMSTNVGKVIQMGQVALESGILASEEAELMPGHYVLFLQNAGVSFKHSEGNKVYRLLKRGDIMAVVGED